MTLSRLSTPAHLDDSTANCTVKGTYVDSPSYVPGYPSFKRFTYSEAKPAILVRPAGGGSRGGDCDGNWSQYPVFCADELGGSADSHGDDDVSWCTGMDDEDDGDDHATQHGSGGGDGGPGVIVHTAGVDASARQALKRACPHMDKLDTFAVFTLWHMSCAADEVKR